MQVVAGGSLRVRAIDQWTRELPITARRGDILDCNGKVLATSGTSYAVYIRTRSVEEPETVAFKLAKILDVDEDALLKKIKAAASSEITVKRQVDKETVLELENEELAGVYYSIDNTRVYPFGDMLCSTIGYTSIDGSGLTGLEAYYNSYLSGVNGEILFEADLVGKDLKSTPAIKPAVDGLDLKLTIDGDVQLIAEKAVDKAFQEYSPVGAAVIVMNPQNGKILALAESERFDLNSPPRDDLEALNSMSRNGLIADSYEPGSTFKIVTALADINEHLSGNPKALSLTYVFNSSGTRLIQGRTIKCWTKHEKGKHANETLSEALNNSCNPCFVDIAMALGKETMYKYIENLNFGAATGIDFPGEAGGMLLPVSAVTDGDIARISFGQTIAVTPLQLAAAACACVNGGIYYAPQIAESLYDRNSGVTMTFEPRAKKRVASEQASKILASYLERVVSEGSGKNAYIEGYKVGGKTGTAQKFENGAIKQGKYVMSFMGFFPSDKPKYLAIAIVDEPVGGSYGSTVAAPIVKEVFEQIIQVKNVSRYN